MKKIITSFLLLGLMMVFTTHSFSQIKKTYTTKKLKPASFIVTLDFSYGLPLQELRGEMGEQFSFKNYGTKFGVGGHLNYKLIVGKKGEMRPYITTGYTLFTNSDDNNAYLKYNETRLWPDTATINPVAGKSKLYFHIFTAALGFEYAFIGKNSKSKWTPYINADFALNVLFGTYKQTPNSVPAGFTSGEIPFTYKSATRFGISAGIGVDGRLTKSVGINIGVKYRIANLIGKESKSTGEINKWELNDKAATNLTSQLSKNRNIGYINFYLGAAFYIGKK